jgi:nonribosomal peptide synthetase DhbF
LTAQVLIDIDCEKCYRTGDLARLDVISGELVFIGRRDYQVKLRGQRIELGEIEETVIKGSMLITGCIVMKFTYHEQEHLVAYVETSSSIVKEDDLRDYCHSRLPFYMIPSMFIILKQFPLTVNGKIDRKALPSPDFVTFIASADDHTVPLNNMEKRVHDLWCAVLHLEHIPMKKCFFALRGSSLLFMKLYNLYRIEFGYAPDIVKCFRHASIIEHAQFLSEMFVSSAGDRHQAWSSLQVDHGRLVNFLYCK